MSNNFLKLHEKDTANPHMSDSMVIILDFINRGEAQRGAKVLIFLAQGLRPQRTFRFE